MEKRTNDLDDVIIEKAQTDPEFRKALLASPRDAFKKWFGIAIPEHLRVNVIEDNDACLNIVLPPAGGSRELKGAELDAVAGGGRPILSSCTGCTTGSTGKWLTHTTILGTSGNDPLK